MRTSTTPSTTEPLLRLREMQQGTTRAQGLALFDSLPAVTVEQVLGRWVGGEVPTGNPMDGMLGGLGWYGKYFDGPDVVHPLVFRARSGRLTSVNPALTPLGVALRFPGLARRPEAARLLSVLRPLVATRRPRARLRMTEYRGVLSATMIYDAQPVHDVFRGVDDDTLLGAMDLRGLDAPFLFTLTRVTPHTLQS